MAADAATEINKARTRISKARKVIFLVANILLQNAESEINLAILAFSQTDFESAKQHSTRSNVFVNKVLLLYFLALAYLWREKENNLTI